jgi:hypothetical protein
MLAGMDKEEIWGARVRAWQASGKSLSEFSRDKEFTASGLSYWVRRLGAGLPTPTAAKPVRLARVVRTGRTERSGPTRADRQSVQRASVSAPTGYVVIEAGALRVHVPEQLEMARLEAVLTAVGRMSQAGAA